MKNSFQIIKFSVGTHQTREKRGLCALFSFFVSSLAVVTFALSAMCAPTSLKAVDYLWIGSDQEFNTPSLWPEDGGQNPSGTVDVNKSDPTVWSSGDSAIIGGTGSYDLDCSTSCSTQSVSGAKDANISSGTITFDNGSFLQLSTSGSVLDIQGGTLNANGITSLSSGTAINITDGFLNLGSGGSFNISGGASLNVSAGVSPNFGTFDWSGGSLNNSGDIVVNGGLFSVSTGGNQNLGNISVTNEGEFRVLNDLTHSLGTVFNMDGYGELNLQKKQYVQTTLTNEGTLNLGDLYISIYNGGVIIPPSAFTPTTDTYTGEPSEWASPKIVNNGIVNTQADDVQLNMSNNFITFGTYNGIIFENNATFNVNGLFYNDYVFSQNGGTLTISSGQTFYNAFVLDWNGGTIANNGILALDGGSLNVYADGNPSLGGTINVDSGGLLRVLKDMTLASGSV